MARNFQAYLAVTFAVLLWGISFVATKVALQQLPPFVLLFIRFTVASCLMFPIWYLLRRERLRGSDWILLAVLAVLMPGFYFVFETYGILYTTASTASLIIATIPVFVSILAFFWLREELRPAILSGILITLCGVFLLVWNGSGSFSLSTSSFLGNLLILMAALCASGFTIVSRRLGKNYGAWTLTTFQTAFGAIFYLPWMLREWQTDMYTRLSSATVSAVLFLALFATFGAFLLYNYSLKVLEASRVAVFINMIPVVTVLAAWLVLDERLVSHQMLGAVLVLVGVTITTRPSPVQAYSVDTSRR